MDSKRTAVAFDTGGRILMNADGDYWVMGSDIPILAVGNGTADDARKHFSAALGSLGKYLVSTRGLDGAADYLASRGITHFELEDDAGTRVLGENVRTAVYA